MFKTLLWKEWRESRLLLFIMVIGTPLASLILEGLNYGHKDTLAILYFMIGISFAVLLTAIQFSNKAEPGTIDFSLPSPVHWFKIWLIKTLYGICTLTVIGFYLILLSCFFIPSLTESVSVFEILFIKTPSSTPPPALFIEIVLFTITLCLYFTGCIVSANLKSSLKAVLVTFLVIGFLYYIMLSSSLLLNYTSSNYIFWIIFPVLVFVIFLKCQSNYYLIRVSYWILTIGGILFWIIFAIKSISLHLLIPERANSFFSFSLSPTNALFSLLLISFLISSILTSMFAFGIHQKKYPAWWRSINCFNLLIIFTICTSAILFAAIPTQEDNRVKAAGLSKIIIRHDRYLKLPLIYKGIFPYMAERVSCVYSIVNENNGEVHSLGHGKFMVSDFQDVSIERQWAYYSCPTLKWGVYYKCGLWAENLITNRQYLLMTGNNIPTIDYIEEEWFDKGTRLIIVDRDSNKKTLFSVKNGMPQKIKEEQEPGKSWLLHIDINNKLYFYNSMNGIVSCYNHELIKEYELSVVKDKMNEIISSYFQNEKSNHNKDLNDIDFDNFTQVERDGTIRSMANKNQPFIFYQGPNFSISPDGKYMIFSLRPNSNPGESEIWCVSLPDGYYNTELKLINSPYSYRWTPDTGKVLDPYDRENKVDLLDFKRGISKNIIKGNFYRIQDKFPIEWSDNGKYIITYSFSNTSNGRTVNIYRFDSDTLTCSLVSSRADLTPEMFGILERWSSDRSQVVFREFNSDNIWRLDLNKGTWSEIKRPFIKYQLLGVSNKGDVYLNSSNSSNLVRIYRINETDSKLIYESRSIQDSYINRPREIMF
jgi:hypothetical protein